MAWEFWRRLSFLWKRRQIDRDLEEEMRFHVDMKARRDRTRPPSRNAESAAHRAPAIRRRHALAGDFARGLGLVLLEHLLQDLRYAARMLRHNPGFTTVAVLSLALGIGANTAIFSLIDTVLLRMLPVQNPEQLVFVDNVGARGGGGAPPYPCFEQFRDRDHYFSGLSAFSPYNMRISIDGRPEEVMAQQASGNYFAVLGLEAWAGRTFGPADDSVIGKGGPDGPVAVISYRYWKRRFAMSPAVLGKVIQVEGRAVTIIGVTPPEFFGLRPGMPVDLTVPMMLAPAEMLRDKGVLVAQRGRPPETGRSRAQARAELDGIFQAFMDDRSGSSGKISGSDEMRHDYFDHIELTPAARGLEQPAAPILEAAAGAHGVGWPGAADRLRERSESAAGAHHGAQPGVRRAPGARARDARASCARCSPKACCWWVSATCSDFCSRVGQAGCWSRSSPRAGITLHWICTSTRACWPSRPARIAIDRIAVWPGAGLPRHQDNAPARPEGTGPRPGWRALALAVGQTPGGFASRTFAGAVDWRRLVCAQPLEPAQPGRRLSIPMAS
jgi:hypothetical protein